MAKPGPFGPRLGPLPEDCTSNCLGELLIEQKLRFEEILLETGRGHAQADIFFFVPFLFTLFFFCFFSKLFFVVDFLCHCLFCLCFFMSFALLLMCFVLRSLFGVVICRRCFDLLCVVAPGFPCFVAFHF